MVSTSLGIRGLDRLQSEMRLSAPPLRAITPSTPDMYSVYVSTLPPPF